MKNTLKLLTVLSLLAGFSACGDDDGGDDTNKGDSGPPVKIMDGGVPDTSVPTMDSGNTQPDSGTPVQTGCFTGTPTTMANFLNRCTDVQNATKTITVPTSLLTPSGDVLPL
jgi:hypothetical protein